MARKGRFNTFLNAAVASAQGTSMDVTAFEHVMVSIAGAGTADGTVKCMGSIAAAEPTWGSAQSPTNAWDYIFMYDANDNSTVDGDTGVVFSGDDVKQFIVNTENLRWLNFDLTRVGGNFTVKGYAMNDTR